jgi:hypothetical protein
MGMWTLFKIEWLKLKRTKILVWATFLPLFAVFQGKLFVDSLKGTERGEHEWEILFTGSISMYSSLIFPLLITVIMAIIAKVEHSQNGWKHLLALPVRREHVYFSKLTMGMIIVLYNTAVLCIGMLVAGLMIGTKDAIPYDLIVGKPLMAYLSALPIMALQFYLSFRFSHIGIPLAFGIGMSLPSMLVANSEKYWIYYPWTYPIFSTLTNMFQPGEKETFMYGICFILFFIIILTGLVKFKSKDIL